MRTTITLDPDVEQLLKNVIRERDISFKEAVNDAIRAGLKSPANKRLRFRQRTFPMGAAKGLNWDKALTMADDFEDGALIRKMALGR